MTIAFFQRRNPVASDSAVALDFFGPLGFVLGKKYSPSPDLTYGVPRQTAAAEKDVTTARSRIRCGLNSLTDVLAARNAPNARIVENQNVPALPLRRCCLDPNAVPQPHRSAKAAQRP
jgi:hypothetical protein